MASVTDELKTAIFNELSSQLLHANPAPKTPEDGLKDMAGAIATAIVNFLPAHLNVTTPASQKCTVAWSA
jgi:hypothetical protein